MTLIKVLTFYKFCLIILINLYNTQQQRTYQLHTDPDCQFTPGKFWNSQTCLECKNENCFCDQEYGCTHCKENYYYNESLQDCFQCPAGCKDCCMNSELTLITCTSCFSGYFKISGTCIEIRNCIQQSLGFCDECEKGYYLNQFHRCSSCDYTNANGIVSKCSECYLNTYCTECSEGYYLSLAFNSFGQKLCNQCSTAFCSECENNVCSKCIDGYLLNEEQVCEQCIIDKCSTCLYDQGVQICSICKNIQEVNQITGETETINYFLKKTNDQYECVTCDVLFPNCFLCIDPQLSDIYCQLCEFGYYLNEDCINDSSECCKQCPENVQKCYSPTSIQQCIDGYLLVNDETQGLICVQNTNNCALMNTEDGYFKNDSCQQCKQKDYKNQNQQCISCNIENCIKCVDNQANQCQICDSLFYQQSGQCLQCTIQNCEVCQEQNNLCQKCLSQYKLDPESGECQLCEDPNCSTCNQNISQCDKCIPGFGLQNDLVNQEDRLICKQCVFGCEECVEQQKCLKCKENFYLSLKYNVCIPHIKNCLEMIPKFQYEAMIELDLEKKQEILDQKRSEEDLINEPMYCKVCDVDIINNKHYKSKGFACTWCNNVQAGVLDCPHTCKAFQYPILKDSIVEGNSSILKYQFQQQIIIILIIFGILSQA